METLPSTPRETVLCDVKKLPQPGLCEKHVCYDSNRSSTVSDAEHVENPNDLTAPTLSNSERRWQTCDNSSGREPYSKSKKPFGLKRPRPASNSSSSVQQQNRESRLLRNELREIALRLFRFELVTDIEYRSKRQRETAHEGLKESVAEPCLDFEHCFANSDEDSQFTEEQSLSRTYTMKRASNATYSAAFAPNLSTGSTPPPEMFELRWSSENSKKKTSNNVDDPGENSNLLAWYCA
jgi:hypothetical protein